MDQLTALDGCKRCPTCHEVPKMSIEDGYQQKDLVWLHCQPHGNIAAGETLEQAVTNWNRWVDQVVRVAGIHFLENGGGKPNQTYCTVCGDQTPSKDFPDRVECDMPYCKAVKLWKSDAPRKRRVA